MGSLGGSRCCADLDQRQLIDLPRMSSPVSRLWTMARASRGSSANLAVGTTLYVRHLPHLINIWLSTTRRSAVDHRHQPASATMPHAPQTRSSLSLPIGNSKGWRALKSTIDAAGWGMPIVRSLVCVRVTAECFRQERCILSRPSRNQEDNIGAGEAGSGRGGCGSC
jgi:hypothetical protein